MADRIEDGGTVEVGLVGLIRTAVRFYDLAAGEGLVFDGQPDPADYISEFLDANIDAWDRLDSFVAEAIAAKDAEITRLRAENEDGGQAVRTLIWVHRPAGAATSERYDAETRFGRYSVYLRDNGVVEWGWASSPPITDAASEEAAKAAAQADFESRILSEIIPARARQIGLSVGSADHG